MKIKSFFCVIITGMKKMGDYFFPIQEDVIRGCYPFCCVLFGVEVSYINAFCLSKLRTQ